MIFDQWVLNSSAVFKMSKFLISLIIVFLLIFVLKIEKVKLIFSDIFNEEEFQDNNQFGEKKKITIECKLSNEIINRDNIDSERQCYYTCSEDDIIRVDTSISFPCQSFIREER